MKRGYIVRLGVYVLMGLFTLFPLYSSAQGNVPFDPTGGQFGNTGSGSGASNSGVNAGQVFGPSGPAPTFDPTGGQFGNTGSGSGASNSGINAGQVFNQNSANQTPLSGNAGTETGLVKCGVSRDCTICDIFILIRDIFTFALGLLASLAVLSMVIGGIYILVSAGNSGLVSQGYSIITNAVVGLLLVMASFLLFSFLLVSLGFQEANFSAVLTFQPGRLFEVKCDNASTFNSAGPNGGGQATTGGGSGNVGINGIACLDATNIDDETSAVMRTISRYESGGAQNGYYKLTGGKVYANSTTVHPGVTDVNLFRANGGSDAFGRYQMISTTWNGWASKAGVPLAQQGSNSKGENYYNISPQYQDAAVAGTLKQNNINTCSSFFASARRGGYAATQWVAFASNTTGLRDGENLCNQLLQDEKTGACKQ